MVRLLVVFVLFSFFCAGLSAGSVAEEIEMLLATEAVTYSMAARVILDASEKMITSDYEEAFNYVQSNNWLPKNAEPDAQANLSGIALMIMHAFDIKGGVMFSITKAPHFAYRELVHINIIVGRIDPSMHVTGEYLLLMITRTQAFLEKN